MFVSIKRIEKTLTKRVRYKIRVLFTPQPQCFPDCTYWIINVFVFGHTRFRLGFAWQSAAKTGRTAGLYITMINWKKNKILRSRKTARRGSHVLCCCRSFPLIATACAYTIYLVAFVLFRVTLGRTSSTFRVPAKQRSSKYTTFGKIRCSTSDFRSFNRIRIR